MMCLDSCVIDSSFIFVHPLILPHVHPSLLNLRVKHLCVLVLPHSLAIFLIFESLLLSECIHACLLQQAVLELDLIMLHFIVVLNLMVQTLVDHSSISRLSLHVIDFTSLQLPQSFLLVKVFVKV